MEVTAQIEALRHEGGRHEGDGTRGTARGGRIDVVVARTDPAPTTRDRFEPAFAAALWNRTGPEHLVVEGDPGGLGQFLQTVHVR